MALNYLPTTNYTDRQAAWTAMIGAADFWDSIDGNTVTVDGLTLGFDAGTNNITVSGYGLSATLSVYSASSIMIAATEKSLIFKYMISSSNYASALLLDKNSNNEWGAVVIPLSTTSGNAYYITPNATATELALRTVATVTATLTQLAPVTGTYSTDVMENGFIVLTSPNPAYVGKMELNGVKYVMAGRAAISYTD